MVSVNMVNLMLAPLVYQAIPPVRQRVFLAAAQLTVATFYNAQVQEMLFLLCRSPYRECDYQCGSESLISLPDCFKSATSRAVANEAATLYHSVRMSLSMSGA